MAIGGTIQSGGALVGYSAKTECISLVSDTLSDFSSLQPGPTLLGRPIGAIFDRMVCHDLRNACALPSIERLRESIEPSDLGAGTVQLSAFRTHGTVIVEITPGAEAHPSSLLLKDLSRLVDRIEASADIGGMLQDCVALLRVLSGYDRVLAVRFADQGGEIIAQHSRASLAVTADQFRALPETIDRWNDRHILDASSPQAALLMAAPVNVDLSLSDLMSPTAADLACLKTQGMAASLTVPLKVGSSPWGLLWFQHRHPRRIPVRARMVLEAVTPIINATLAAR